MAESTFAEPGVPTTPPAPFGGAMDLSVGSRLELAAFGLLSVAVGLLYFHDLGVVPSGLFCDETSVGYNAWTIGHGLRDGHGVLLPLFFQCFGDFKSPLYVYAAALTVRLFGPTPFAVRLPSVLYALGMALVLHRLLAEWTGNRRVARWTALLSLLCPSIFTFGRHAVSEVSSFPFWLVLAFLMLLRFERGPTARRGALAGLALGACTYSYTTARMLAPLSVAVAAASFALSRPHRRALPAFLGAAALAGLPMGVFMLVHPGMLTQRFDLISVFRDHPTAGLALRRVLENYRAQLLSPGFLFRTGDHNPRHNVGVGLLPVWLAVPFVLGLAALWERRRGSPLSRFLLVFLLIAPIPAALTDEGIPHASRMLQLAPFAFAVAGLAAADWIERARPPRAALAFVLGLALLEGGIFLGHYFGDYAQRSQGSFDGGAGEALRVVFAARREGEPLYLSPEIFGLQNTYIEFWGSLDQRELAEKGPDGLGIHRLWGGQGNLPSGALVVSRGAYPPRQPAERIGESDGLGGGVPYSVYRIR